MVDGLGMKSHYLSTSRGPMIDLDPEDRNQEMIRNAENSKVQIFATQGNSQYLKDNLDNLGKGVSKGTPQRQLPVNSSAFLDEGYIVVGAHIDDNMVTKIVKGEYVDFGKLIPHD